MENPIRAEKGDGMKLNKYYVTWEEHHAYKYYATVEARSKSEAKVIACSHEDNDDRVCEFDRVVHIGRKKASLLKTTPPALKQTRAELGEDE